VRTLLILAAALVAGGALPASAEPKKCSVGKMLELPVTMSDLRPLIPATINGHEVRFIADSGAFYSAISPGSAAELGLRLGAAPAGLRVMGVGGEAHISVARVKDFGIGPVMLHNIEFMVGGSETGSTGLLGQNVLGIADVEYDLAGAAIRLMRPHDCDHTNLAYWAGDKPVSILDIETPSNSRLHTQGTVILNGVKIRAIFDTGAPTSMLTTAAAARAGVKPDTPGVVPAGFSSGLGRHSLPTWIGSFQSLGIGDEEIRKIHLRFGDISDGSFDMLIGADFFLSHRVYVSNGQHKLFFTYNGGAVFDLTVRKTDPKPVADTGAAEKPGAEGAPTTAAAFSLRGNARSARRDFPRALSDLTRAVELAPDNADYRYQRAVVLMRSGRQPEAMADLDRALTLKHDYADALLFRAGLRLGSDDKAGARKDVDAAERAVAGPSDLRLSLGQFYDQLGDPEAAIVQFDRWIAAHPADSRLAMALNGRCWTRALAGRDLDKAVADCDRALRLTPRTAAILDSRGLAHLRGGDLDKALADYNAALALEPKMAWSLYGRGLVEARKGLAAQSRADIAAAIALQPGLPADAKKYGIAEPSKPPAGQP
jgi:tetratricopeptide (TPR) repeat protein/predicted aspartyl protease